VARRSARIGQGATRRFAQPGFFLKAVRRYGGPYLRSGATSVASRLGAQEDPPMQSHAEHIQAILARELDTHRRQVALVQASLLTVPPRSSGIAAGARAQGPQFRR